MCTNRSRRGRALVSALLTMVMIAMAVGAGLWLYARTPGGAYIDENTTLSILHSESMAFLMTRRMSTQVVVEHAEGDWLGDWRGVLWATVRIHYGVDLQKVQAEDIRSDGDAFIVRLPEPEMLDFAMEPGSEGFLSKSTAIAKIQDLLHNGQRRKLEQSLRDAALEFAARQDMLPTREELVNQLNAAIAALNSPAGLKLRFE